MAYRELGNSIKTNLADRFSSPLFGSFIISWCLWNYRLLFTLFSSENFIDKFKYIDETLYSNYGLGTFLQLLVFPLLTAVIFLLAYPFPARWIFKFWREQQKTLASIRQKIDDETPVTIEELKKIKIDHNGTIDIFRSDLLRKENEIERYRTQLKKANDDMSLLQKNLDEAKQTPKNVGQNRFISDQEIKQILINDKYTLFFNPRTKEFKEISFLENGEIGEGRNNNESKWSIKNGVLEITQSSGSIHSRFHYLPDSGLFTHTNDADTPSIKGQYIIRRLEKI